MSPVLVVERHLFSDALLCLRNGAIGLEINPFVLQTAPETLDKHIVHPAALAIHADLNVMDLKFYRPVSGIIIAINLVICNKYLKRE